MLRIIRKIRMIGMNIWLCLQKLFSWLEKREKVLMLVITAMGLIIATLIGIQQMSINEKLYRQANMPSLVFEVNEISYISSPSHITANIILENIGNVAIKNIGLTATTSKHLIILVATKSDAVLFPGQKDDSIKIIMKPDQQFLSSPSILNRLSIELTFRDIFDNYVTSCFTQLLTFSFSEDSKIIIRAKSPVTYCGE